MPIADPYGGPAKGPIDPYAEASPTDWRASAWDVAKQVPAGLVAGTEAAISFPAQVAGMLAPYANRVVGAIPNPLGGSMSDPEAERRQAVLRTLAGGRRSADYLPKPETTAGEYARTAAEFVPAAVTGSRMAVPRAIGVGTTAGLVSEGAGQATKGTDLEAPARIAGGLLAGVGAGRMAEGAAIKSAAQSVGQQVREESNVLYDQFRNSGFQLAPDAAKTLSSALVPALERQGFTDVTAGPVLKAIDRWATKPWTQPQQFQAAYQELGHLTRSAEPSVRNAANIAQENLLTFLERDGSKFIVGGPGGVAYAGPQGTVLSQTPDAAAALFQKANANWAAAKRVERLDQKIAAGELRAGANYSGLNLENELRRRVGVLADPNVRGGYSPAEQQAFEQFAKGTFRSNAPRYVKNLLGGGGGIGATIVGGGGFGLGSYLSGGDPVTGTLYGAAVPLAGLGLAKYGNLRALNKARELELMLLKRAPSANIPGTSSGVPYSLAAPTLATLGEER